MPFTGTTSSLNLKRKAENAVVDQPRKLQVIAEDENNFPLQPSRTGVNRATATRKAPAPLTKPAAPPLRTSVIKRATSAPPKATVPIRPVAGRTTRTASGSVQDKRFQSLQDQVSSIESARAADAARLAAEMDRERSKLSELQANHVALTRELAAAKTQELTYHQEVIHASDQIDQLKKQHTRELEDLELDMRRKDREIRELKEELHAAQADVERERQTVVTLKATVSQQATAQISLSTQISVMQAERSAFLAQQDGASCKISDLGLLLEMERKRTAELEREVRDAETLRRKLHNMIQELKGNIRVFCRVRPLLPSDVGGQFRSSSSSGSIGSRSSPDNEDSEKLKEQAMARIAFPDKMDHKEIVLQSSSESATGQERKDEWVFSFDRVIFIHDFVRPATDHYSI